MNAIGLWTIYDHPADYPEHWVVRMAYVSDQGVSCAASCELFRDVQQARDYIQQQAPGASCLQHAGEDPDPVIYEVWWP